MKEKTKSDRFLRKLLNRMRRIFRKRPEPEDPYAYSMALLKRPPKGRSGAAVAELDEE